MAKRNPAGNKVKSLGKAACCIGKGDAKNSSTFGGPIKPQPGSKAT